MTNFFWLLTAVTLISGCTNPLNQRHVSFYTSAGGQAEVDGNWPLSEKNFERALINATFGNTSDREKSMALYNLGRANGHLCKFDEAEKLLTDSLILETKVSGPESGITSMRLFELGRLHLDRQQFEKSAPYFAQAIPIVLRLDVARNDPLGLATVYQDYALALLKTGKLAEAEAAKREASRLQTFNSGRPARFVPSRYSQNC